MVIPPTFSDLGKCARDLFDKGYNYGYTKIDVKTKTSSGIEFISKGSSAAEDGKITGSLETKYTKPDYGFSFTEKWTTDNNVTSDISIENQIATGLKMTLSTQFAPNTAKRSGVLKAVYKRENLTTNLDSTLDSAGPVLQGAAVGEYEGWLAGYQFGFDVGKSSLIKNNFAVGYNGADYQMLFNVNDASEFSGSVYQSINTSLTTGIQLAWTAGQSNTRFGVAAKYNIDDDSSLNTKVNNSGQIGVGYSRNLSAGVKLTLSSLIEAKDINAGGHQLGFGFEFEV